MPKELEERPLHISADALMECNMRQKHLWDTAYTLGLKRAVEIAKKIHTENIIPPQHKDWGSILSKEQCFNDGVNQFSDRLLSALQKEISSNSK